MGRLAHLRMHDHWTLLALNVLRSALSFLLTALGYNVYEQMNPRESIRENLHNPHPLPEPSSTMDSDFEAWLWLRGFLATISR